jgi:tetratricopeptide (TPR) repeat protein
VNDSASIQMNTNKRLQMFDKLIAQGSQDPFVRYARALELRGLGELAASLQALEEVRTLHPDYVPTFLMAGQIATALDQLEQARAWLSQGIAVSKAARDEHARSELQAALDALPS